MRPGLSRLFTWRTAIAESDLAPGARHVALTLSLHMNEVGDSCFPSQETLARETGLSVRQVRRHLQTLRQAQYVRVTYKERASGRRAFYLATVPIEAHVLSDLEPDDSWGDEPP